MKEIKKVLICGLGAIGTIYADAISNYSPENLKILVDESRLERYKKNPIIFNGKQLDLNYILPSDTSFKPDLVIISTKYDGFSEAVKNIEKFVYDDTVILSLLNGVTSEKTLIEKFGKDHILYSYFIGHSAVRIDRNVTQDGVNTIVFGSPEDNINVARVQEFFDRVGINYKIPEDIIYSMWLKYMLNVSSNQVSAILRLTFGEMQNNEKCMELLASIMKEVQVVAKAEGVNNTEKMIDDAFNSFMIMSPEGKTSMLQDIEAGRKTEVDMFAGVIIELGLKHNIKTPYNLILKQLIDSEQYGLNKKVSANLS